MDTPEQPKELQLKIPALKKSSDKFEVPDYLKNTSNITELNIRLWVATGCLQRVK